MVADTYKAGSGHLVVIRETLAQSVLSDVATLLTILSVFGAAHFIFNASAWVYGFGAFMLFVHLSSKAFHKVSRGSLTPDDLRALADIIESK